MIICNHPIVGAVKVGLGSIKNAQPLLKAVEHCFRAGTRHGPCSWLIAHPLLTRIGNSMPLRLDDYG